MQQKKRQEDLQRIQNAERATAIQREKIDARLRSDQERSLKLERMREQLENERCLAEAEVQEAESRLPELEAQEMLCLQRLQNSKMVTQSVLEELETSLGRQSSMTALLRQKTRGRDQSDMIEHRSHAGIICEEYPSIGSPNDLSQ